MIGGTISVFWTSSSALLTAFSAVFSSASPCAPAVSCSPRFRLICSTKSRYSAWRSCAVLICACRSNSIRRSPRFTRRARLGEVNDDQGAVARAGEPRDDDGMAAHRLDRALQAQGGVALRGRTGSPPRVAPSARMAEADGHRPHAGIIDAETPKMDGFGLQKSPGPLPTPARPTPSNGAMTLALNDIRFAVRGLRRSPLFATVAILSLALGIGANTAIFTLIDQILLRKLPVARSGRAGDALPAGRAQRQQHGLADALVSALPGYPEAGRAALRGALPAAGGGVGQHRQPDRAGRRRDGVGQLLLDARRASRRSAACSTRRRTTRSTRGIRSSC